MNAGATLHYDPRLVEEAVFHAQRLGSVSQELQESRNRLYEVSDTDAQEDLFNDLNRSWFVRLHLGKTIEGALQEQPIITEQVEQCFVVRATHRKQEGAELFVARESAQNNPQRRTLRVLLCPESLFDAEALTLFLRHELFHIADMLDPRFGYEPVLPNTDGGPTYDTLIVNRYGVLWDTTINGRMMQRGWLTDSVRDQQLRDFCRAFPMLGQTGEECFRIFFHADQPNHAKLTRFAFDPRAAAGRLEGQSAVGTHCPLCKFPSHSFEPEPESFADEVLTAIIQDFPQWTPAQGLCTQCADLYRASRLSRAAARALPGWISDSSKV
ncbi:MAG: hypothetical protein OEN50_18455 [Deltaproteobacteria bacterium]|nr:hypothetical protein [Deltaproteobacteria bacterium]